MLVQLFVKTLIFFLITMQVHAEPPRTIPTDLIDKFTWNGSIPVTHWYFDNTYPSSKPLRYTKKLVDDLIKKACEKRIGYYGSTDKYLYRAFDTYKDKISHKQVAIIGSVTPWYEAIVLSYQGIVTTIDYNAIYSEHPDIKTLTVSEFRKTPMTFDAVIAISSVGHDGLGSYGDPLDPDGDFKAMNDIRKMLRPDGVLFLAVPIGKDRLFWNALRQYGVLRLPRLLQGWKTLDTFGLSKERFDRVSFSGYQPIFVLSQE